MGRPPGAKTKVSPERAGIRIPRAPHDIPTALRMASWVSVQLCRGNIGHADAKAIIDALREFRELLGARDLDDKVAEIKTMLTEAKAVKNG
jgi:hypothetical protein